MLLSAGILLAGLSYEPFHKVMTISGIQFLGKSLFYTVQIKFLFPAGNRIYSKKREIITVCKSVDVIGDRRYGSPGNNAMYCTYTLMHCGTNQILHFFIAHHTACNSQQMEAYSFPNVLDMLKDVGEIVASITRQTDISR